LNDNEQENAMSNPTAVEGVEGFKSMVGKELGPSDWVEITQEMVNTFAEATGDHQWIHVDVDRATRESPFGGPIAHGYLTLSLTPVFLPQLINVTGFSMGVNYGAEKVRFPSPVPVGSKLRALGVVDRVTDVAGGVQAQVTLTFEVAGGTKPACVATIVVRNYV
jgi:acyl dehydratase